MHTKSVRMSRQELYEKVWSTPIVQLAQTYGISGTGLAKVCRKWKIPVPGEGTGSA